MTAPVRNKIVVLDDDPTGCQTVHSCLLLTRWDVDTLVEALMDASPLMFVLTNTRALTAERAAAVTREVSTHLVAALERLAQQGCAVRPLFVSRSDSTLRGHYPVETDIMNEVLGPFDAHFLVPAFFEGGRITRNGTHYLMVDGKPVPVHETEFARDSVFGYHHSHLPDYVAEKTAGRIPAASVRVLTPLALTGEPGRPLRVLHDNACVVVDAETPADLERFARHVHASATSGKHWLFRSAASLLTALARLEPQPVAAEHMATYTRNGRPGVVVVGSHVPTTTRQLERLLLEPGVVGIEIDVSRLPHDRQALFDTAVAAVFQAYARDMTAVVYTSRTERSFASQSQRLAFGEQVSGLLMDIVRVLPQDIGFLISKGGITSNDVLSDGLALASSRVLGQILPGCPVVRCPGTHARYPDLPVVIFPGNVGNETALATVWRRLSGAMAT